MLQGVVAIAPHYFIGSCVDGRCAVGAKVDIEPPRFDRRCWRRMGIFFMDGVWCLNVKDLDILLDGTGLSVHADRAQRRAFAGCSCHPNRVAQHDRRAPADAGNLCLPNEVGRVVEVQRQIFSLRMAVTAGPSIAGPLNRRPKRSRGWCAGCCVGQQDRGSGRKSGAGCHAVPPAREEYLSQEIFCHG